MTVGEIAGLVAALAFVVLVAMTAVPLVKLGRVLDEMSTVVRDVGTGTTPILDELKETVEVTNTEIARLGSVTNEVEKVTADVARVTNHASVAVENTAMLTRVVSAAVGRPLVEVASTAHGVRAALAAKRERRSA